MLKNLNLLNLLFDNAEHGISYIIDPDNYVKKTSAFLKKYDL